MLGGNTHGQDPQSYLLAWQGDVEVLFTPDPEPLLDGDLMGGVLSLRSPDETTLVTFGEITFTNLHHVARSGALSTVTRTETLAFVAMLMKFAGLEPPASTSAVAMSRSTAGQSGPSGEDSSTASADAEAVSDWPTATPMRRLP